MNAIFHSRLEDMASSEARKQRVVTGATALWTALETQMSVEHFIARPSDTGSASMTVRRIHNDMVGPARRHHCAAALFRSEGLIAELEKRTPKPRDSTFVHKEHTVQVNVVLRILHSLYLQGRLKSPEDVLEAIFKYGVVCAVLQTERRESDGLPAAVWIDRPRMLDGDFKRAWSRHHPEFPNEVSVPDDAALCLVRPFRRYLGTGLRVFSVPIETEIPLASFTIKDHLSITGPLKIYDAAFYFTKAAEAL